MLPVAGNPTSCNDERFALRRFMNFWIKLAAHWVNTERDFLQSIRDWEFKLESNNIFGQWHTSTCQVSLGNIFFVVNTFLQHRFKYILKCDNPHEACLNRYCWDYRMARFEWVTLQETTRNKRDMWRLEPTFPSTKCPLSYMRPCSETRIFVRDETILNPSRWSVITYQHTRKP